MMLLDDVKELDDRKLIELYLNNQKQLYFHELYGRYADKVYGKCLSMLKDSTAAEDAAQEVFTKIFLKLSTYNGQAKFSTWLYRITYNFCIDLIRKQKRKYNILSADEEQLPELADVDDVSDSEFLELEIKRLKRALEKIPPEDKAALIMKYQQGMPVKELATIMDKSESAIKMKLKRAKQKVKKYYDTIITTIYIILDFISRL